jgi:hypothetical protein
VDFHEREFASAVATDNSQTLEKGFWFQRSAKERTKVDPFGPSNPQALSRYTYTLNNPLQYVDPTGHKKITVRGGEAITAFITQVGAKISADIGVQAIGMGVLAAAGCALTTIFAGACAVAAAAGVSAFVLAASAEKDNIVTVLGQAATFAGTDGYIEVIQDDTTGEVTVVAHNSSGQTKTYTNLGNGSLIPDKAAFIQMSNAATEARRLAAPGDKGNIVLDFYWP